MQKKIFFNIFTKKEFQNNSIFNIFQKKKFLILSLKNEFFIIIINFIKIIKIK
jgi:hypothetical protein